MHTFQVVFITLYFLGALAIIVWQVHHDFKDIEWKDEQ